MNIFRRHRPGRRQAEHLLDGAPVPPGSDDLAGLLAAARGPRPDLVTTGELPGEGAALAAFREAFAGATRAEAVGTSPRTGPLPGRTPPEENSPLRSLALRRMLAVKVLAAGALTVGLGGVAMAATGMPLVPGSDHRGATAAGHASSTGSPTDRPSASGSPQDHGSPSRTGTPGAVRPGRDVRAALLVDCRTWLADHPKASPAPTQNASGRHVEDLVKAAGGADKVAAYCASLADRICPTARPQDAARSGGVPGYLPGCPKPARTTKATHTRPAPSATRTRPGPTRTQGSPTRTRPTQADPGGRPTGSPTSKR